MYSDIAREALKTFHYYNHKTSLLDDFDHYDRLEIEQKKKKQNILLNKANGKTPTAAQKTASHAKHHQFGGYKSHTTPKTPGSTQTATALPCSPYHGNMPVSGGVPAEMYSGYPNGSSHHGYSSATPAVNLDTSGYSHPHFKPSVNSYSNVSKNSYSWLDKNNSPAHKTGYVAKKPKNPLPIHKPPSQIPPRPPSDQLFGKTDPSDVSEHSKSEQNAEDLSESQATDNTTKNGNLLLSNIPLTSSSSDGPSPKMPSSPEYFEEIPGVLSKMKPNAAAMLLEANDQMGYRPAIGVVLGNFHLLICGFWSQNEFLFLL